MRLSRAGNNCHGIQGRNRPLIEIDGGLRGRGSRAYIHSGQDNDARGSSLAATATSTLSTTEGPIDNKPGYDRIAVLGGGISGLATAYYLAKLLPPEAKIDIYEASDRLGGWVDSKKIQVPGGEVVFEHGPRTLRPHTHAGMIVVELIRELGLEDELLVVTKNSESARNRFIYYPDRLVKMPGPGQDFYDMAWTVLTEDVFTQFWQAFGEPWRRPRDNSLEDESVGSFLARRFGTSHIGDNIVSAVLHGIYAGDINKLSAKSLLPSLWHEEKRFGSLIRGAAFKASRNMKILQVRDAVLDLTIKNQLAGAPIQQTLEDASVYTFKNGMETLTKALASYLRAMKNVQIKTGHPINSVKYMAETDRIKISTGKNLPIKPYAHVISTISSQALAGLTDVPGQFAKSLQTSLQAIPSVTVMVVNLFYKQEGLAPNGFGYLIPRSINFDQNPECALGVVFDSDSTQGQDTVSGTKLTVMLGGHWWDSFDTYPTTEEGEKMARRVLERHLHITESPLAVNVSLHKDCIPQYTVGHTQRMQKANTDLHRAFGGRLAVTGNSYNGVGLNDCVRNAAQLVGQMLFFDAKPEAMPNAKPNATRRPLGNLKRISGLEFKGSDYWMVLEREDGTEYIRSGQ
ncbi:hypothetical protein BP5796_05928 [Coleophoma crateriformis]|uniref:Protoporphyrinogen oxidase n=1 Tax=Coleophoma crateriformis TaxID=565419 RepID=A0A3D8RVS0_9HELO|nr:hypothetical protein BP5796_05928 [Coleophoma crateriformis]